MVKRTLHTPPILGRLERLVMGALVLIFWTSIWVGSRLSSDAFANDDQTISSAPFSGQTREFLLATKNSSLSRPQQQRPWTTGYQNGNYLWTSNPNIPDWMKEYMDWHASVVSNLSEENWKSYKYLILRCYRDDEKCGGASDRLKPVPYVLLAAQRSQRIMLIDWDRPCPLEEFLVPPKNGFSWIVPAFLRQKLHTRDGTNQHILWIRATNLVDKACDQPEIFFHTHIHDAQGGGPHYDNMLGENSFAQVYHHLFRLFFTPSPGVQTLIDRQYLSSGLVPGHYNVAHFRAEYGKEIERHPVLSTVTYLQRTTRNAIRCASELMQGLREEDFDAKPTIVSPIVASENNSRRRAAMGERININATAEPMGSISRAPIYFASDNSLALETVQAVAMRFQYPIVTFQRSEVMPLHLDEYIIRQDEQNESATTTSSEISYHQPSEYYSTFVDLWLAGNGQCVTYGRGGFGRFAALLSFNFSCSTKHVKRFMPDFCKGLPPLDQIPDETK